MQGFFFSIFLSTKYRATTREKYDGRRQTAIRHGEGEWMRQPKYQVGDDSNRGEGTDSGRRTDTTYLDVKNDGTTSRGREERESCQKTQPTESELRGIAIPIFPFLGEEGSPYHQRAV